MATYVNMEDMRGHLRNRNATPILSDQVLKALGDRYDRLREIAENDSFASTSEGLSMQFAGMRFRQLRQLVTDYSDSTLQRSIDYLILSELIDCEYWKSTNRRYFLNVHGLSAYYENCKEQKELISEDQETESVEEQQEQQEPTAKESALNLEPTYLSDEQKTMIQQNVNRLQCFEIADHLNREDNNMLISIQDDHVMVMLGGDFSQIKSTLESLMK
jgi:hypothetical protein